MRKLSGNDIPKLAKILTSTLSFEDLEMFVQASTGDRLFDVYVSKDKPKLPMIVQLLNVLEDLGQTEKFLAYVYINRPGRQDVRDEIVRLFPSAAENPETRKIDLSAQTAGTPQPRAPENAVTPGLQRNVRPYLAKLDIRIWQEKLMRVEQQTCRVEVEDSPIGSGFLVGPDAVLTNWHVLEEAKKRGKEDKLGCRFDFLRLPNNATQAGRFVPLAAPGALDTSPYSKAETTNDPDNPLPTADELDYALLRLAERVGEQQIDGSPRGWIALPKVPQPLPADAPILIVQHPEGAPMKLALDTQAVIGRNGNGTRIRYRTNTEPGSSGSPVFTMDWDLVGLHHYGDPRWQKPLFNQAVPIELVRMRIEKNGSGDALGA